MKRDDNFAANVLRLAMVFAFAGLCVVSACRTAEAQHDFDWKSDWAIEEGFSINIDTEGYHFPTAIAFVPNPGKTDKSPLYFVTELRGKVKVVTNDRTVYTFVEDFFQLKPKQELPSVEGTVGLAGICLDPKHGYVFVTFAYQDTRGVLRNNIIRFQTTPKIFSIESAARLSFADLFSDYEIGINHQIGSCQVKDDLLYVSVGDALKPGESQRIDSLLGKVIRMTLEGQPVPENPFYRDNDIKKAENYAWAIGLRNPFGLKIVGDRVFVFDNGSDIDRFLEIHQGENYLWNGSDWSIGTNAAFVLAPSLGPAQMDFYPSTAPPFLKDYGGYFFTATYANWDGKQPGIVSVRYNFADNKVANVPRYFLKYRGSSGQNLVGLAFGPDGLYFAPVHPNREGKSVIFKITYDPARAHPFELTDKKANSPSEKNETIDFRIVLQKLFPTLQYRHLLIFSIAGIVVGIFLRSIAKFILSLSAKKKQS